MAETFRFERQKSPEIMKPECPGEMEFRGKDDLRRTSSWKSSPSHDDVNFVRTTLKDQLETSAQVVAAEEYDEDEIIASAEKEESPQQKIAFIQPRQDVSLTNFLGEVEDEAGLEMIIVPPTLATSIQGSSKVYPITETAPNVSKEFHDPDGSPESISRLSRIESAKQDMKNLKSATLGRMGKMFKIRPPTPSGHEKTTNQTEEGIDAAATVDHQYGQDPSRKEKTHSLGRMLRLVDKDGAPRKLFSHTRTGSLTRLKKMNSTVGNVANNSEDSRNIFARMLSQFRARNPNGTNAEPNLQSTKNAKENSPKASLGTRLMMSLSARGNSTTAGTTGGETSVESEYTA